MSAPEVRQDPDGTRFVVRVDGEVAGYAEYVLEDGTATFTHTVVDPAYEGQGLGSRLVAGVLASARAQGLVVVPVCPFVRSWLQRHPEQADLVPAELHAELGLG